MPMISNCKRNLGVLGLSVVRETRYRPPWYVGAAVRQTPSCRLGSYAEDTRGHGEREPAGGNARREARRGALLGPLPQGGAADHRGLVRAVALSPADRAAAGDRARGCRRHPLVRPARRDRGPGRARHRLRLSPLLEQSRARGGRGLGARAYPRGGGSRGRASGGHEARDSGRPRPQAGALPPRGRAHDGARPARVRHGRTAAALPRRRAASDGVDAAPAGLISAGGELRRPGAATRARRRPRRAVRHPGRRRGGPAGVSGPAAAGQRRADRGLRRPHDPAQGHRRADAGARHAEAARHSARARALRRRRRRQPRGHHRRRAEGVVRPARGALARARGGCAGGVAACRHLRAAGAQPRGHAAGAAGGGGLRAAAGGDGRAGLPAFRARRRRGLHRAAGGRRGAGRVRSSAWRAIPSCACAWAKRRACGCCTASPRRMSRSRCARPMRRCSPARRAHDARGPARLCRWTSRTTTTAMAPTSAGTGYLVDTSASAISAALAAATRQTTPDGVAPPSTAR